MKTNHQISCANCWGVQSYENKVYDIQIDHNRDIINHRKQDGFIRSFLVKFIDGISLKKIG